MSLKVMFNELASGYATADQFGAISQSHRAALAQIQEEGLGLKPHYKVLDFGVGNGAFLQKLAPLMRGALFTGIDISSEMLALAKQALPIQTIEASAIEASNYLPPHSQDLILAHFVNAYVPIHDLFREADLLSRANGYYSFITTTYESFPKAQQYIAEFISQETLMSTVVGHYYKTMVKNTTVASGLDELMQAFETHQFRVVHHERLHIPISLENIEALIRFGIEGTWFLNTLAIRMLPKHFLLNRLRRLFNKIFTFPYTDTHIIDVVLAAKK